VRAISEEEVTRFEFIKCVDFLDYPKNPQLLKTDTAAQSSLQNHPRILADIFLSTLAATIRSSEETKLK
jgi:hypothetical protein